MFGFIDPRVVRRMAEARSAPHRCETCAFWRGNASSYLGDCESEDNYHARTPFDFTCGEWQHPEISFGRLARKSDEI